jgi:uncharacterized protein YlxP (DUF503 family)
MVIGILRLTLHLPNSDSLKAKRQVVRSLVSRVRRQFEVAAAEVGDRDRWQLAELGVACVRADAPHVDEVLAHVLSFVERNTPEALVSGVSTELIHL